jgi:hypothetical protein
VLFLMLCLPPQTALGLGRPQLWASHWLKWSFTFQLMADSIDHLPPIQGKRGRDCTVEVILACQLMGSSMNNLISALA